MHEDGERPSSLRPAPALTACRERGVFRSAGCVARQCAHGIHSIKANGCPAAGAVASVCGSSAGIGPGSRSDGGREASHDAGPRGGTASRSVAQRTCHPLVAGLSPSSLKLRIFQSACVMSPSASPAAPPPRCHPAPAALPHPVDRAAARRPDRGSRACTVAAGCRAAGSSFPSAGREIHRPP